MRSLSRNREDHKGSADGTIRVWDFETGDEVAVLNDHTSVVSGIHIFDNNCDKKENIITRAREGRKK